MRTQKSKHTPWREGSRYSQCVRNINQTFTPPVVDHLEDQHIPASGREKTGDGASSRVTGLKDSVNAA